MQRLHSLLWIALVFASAHLPGPASAAFHAWRINEIYSNEDGSIQYIEFSSSTSGQEFLNGHDLTATSDGTTITFTFGSNLRTAAMGGPGTSGRTFLVATPGFAALPGAVTPDYTLPCGPFFDPTADAITIDFAGVDSVSFAGTDLPDDAANSMNRTLVAAANTPRAFESAAAGSLALSECQADGTCDACDDGDFCNGVETCDVRTCAEGDAPCDAMCDEDEDECFECDSTPDCDDDNTCTDEECVDRLCVRSNNTDSCDDTLFCTATDVCSDGECVGSGDACPGETCLEGSNTCGTCSENSDCDDGFFCTGTETCTEGVCNEGTDPCDPATTTCSEADDVCDLNCGDGVLLEAEECDDGDSEIEDGFDCNVDVEPSECTPLADPDAGSSDTDAGPRRDAGTRIDGGTEEMDGGCGCRTTSRGESHAWLALIAIGALALRRRRSKKV
jgi:MYXO-CTERM domain-containing protein